MVRREPACHFSVATYGAVIVTNHLFPRRKPYNLPALIDTIYVHQNDIHALLRQLNLVSKRLNS